MIKPRELESDRGRDIWAAMTAAAAGDVATLRGLLDRDPSLARGEYSPLGFAVREGRLDATRLLLDAGADPAEIAFSGDTLIDVATDRGYADIAQLLHDARAGRGRVAPSDSHADHAIHTAAEEGDLGRVRAMLDEDPELVHRSDRAGGTPLHRAVVGGSLPVIELLLERGADIHAVHGAGLGSARGYAPQDQQAIDLALWAAPRDLKVARLLLARGAAYDLTVAAALGDIDRVAAILDEDPSRIRETRPDGRRPLSAAVEFGKEAIVRMLLARGADPTWPDAHDSPKGAALHAAARAGDAQLVELLLAHGADPNGNVNAAGSATYAAKTPELRATLVAHGGRLDPYDLVWLGDDDAVMRRVLEDPESADAGCGGVITAVCTLGKRELLVRLLDAGVRPPAIAGGCQSYLLHNPEMLRLLLAAGMSADYPNWRNLTLLHALCARDIRGRTMSHRSECATILLDGGATISARDDEYRSTPLAWASRNNLPDMVEFLLARGATANLPDDEPWATPLAWATRRGYPRIVEMLRNAGATMASRTADTDVREGR